MYNCTYILISGLWVQTFHLLMLLYKALLWTDIGTYDCLRLKPETWYDRWKDSLYIVIQFVFFLYVSHPCPLRHNGRAIVRRHSSPQLWKNHGRWHVSGYKLLNITGVIGFRFRLKYLPWLITLSEINPVQSGVDLSAIWMYCVAGAGSIWSGCECPGT